MNPDEQLNQTIRRIMLQDGRLSGQAIDLSVADGVVTLRGRVQSYGRKLAALEIASSPDEVTSVIDQLEVLPPGRIPDDQVAEYVRAALDARAEVGQSTIVVSVNNGVAKLSGEVGDYWERVLAEDTALGTKGVTSVKNFLIVDVGEQIEDEALSRRMQEALAYTSGLEKAGIRVTVTGDTAVLSGEVTRLWQKETAEEVVSRFRIMHIQNRIRVADRNDIG